MYIFFQSSLIIYGIVGVDIRKCWC